MITAATPHIVNRLPVVPPPKPVEVYYDTIHMADNEWGNTLMEQIAAVWFANHPQCQFVLIHEHAGWSLGFRRDMSIWTTANDMAVLKPGPRPTAVDHVCRRECGTSYSLRTGESFSSSQE